MLDASLEGSSSEYLLDRVRPESAAVRHPDSWAAYGRFIFAAVRTHCSQRVEAVDGNLRQFSRPIWHADASMLYAYQGCDSANEPVLTAATRTLRQISRQRRVDHLNVYVSGAVKAEDAAGRVLYTVLDDTYIAVVFPYLTNDILEFPPSFEAFLKTLGHSNRRHMKARMENAPKSGIHFDLNSEPSAVQVDELYKLGLQSRPTEYSKETIDSWNAYAMAQPGFFHCMLRSTEGELLSYCIGFVERDSAVMMYQLNHQEHPKLGLSMTLRGFLIRHLTGLGIRRLVLPMGVAGHLEHAATVNPVAQVLFVRRSLAAVAKALLLRFTTPDSHAALMVSTPGFVMRVIAGGVRSSQPALQADTLDR